MAFKSGQVAEQLVCLAASGANSKSNRKVFDCSLCALVATPLLDFSERCLTFLHKYCKGEAVELLSRRLTVRWGGGGVGWGGGGPSLAGGEQGVGRVNGRKGAVTGRCGGGAVTGRCP